METINRADQHPILKPRSAIPVWLVPQVRSSTVSFYSANSGKARFDVGNSIYNCIAEEFAAPSILALILNFHWPRYL